MQRRAAAAYVVFFLVLAAGSYAVIATATAPTVTVEDPNHSLSEGDPLEAGDRTYTVAAIEAKQVSGGDHGGGGGIERSASLEWTNESFAYSAEWIRGEMVENARIAEDGTVSVEFPETQSRNLTFDGTPVNETLDQDSRDAVRLRFENDTVREFVPVPGATIDSTEVTDNGSTVVVEYYEPDVRSYRILVPDNSTLVLREQPFETVERDGTEFAVVDSDGDGTDELVSIAEYEELRRVQLSGDDTLQYAGNESELRIANRNASVHWRAPKTLSVEASHESNVTVGDTTYLAFFPDNSTLLLTTDFQSYSEKVDRASRFHARMNGFWGITILSVVASIFLIALAYLPYKDT